MKKIIRTVTMIMAIVVMLSQPMITYAQQFRLDDSDNWIAVGGVNTYDGTKATTEEEVKALETRLLSEGYIQICGQGVTQTEDYKLLINYWRDKSSPLARYTEDNEYIQLYYKIYVDKDVYDDVIKAFSEGLEPNNVTSMELETSTVVIDNASWYYEALSGTFDTEINDDIPSHIATGYLQIVSPVNIDVVLWNADMNRYYRLYVMKNKPFLVKLKRGSYHITEINKMEVNNNVDDNGEDALPYNNRIQITGDCTYENPYLLDFTDITVKYELTDEDISGKPDLSIDKNQNIPKDPTVSSEDTNIDDNNDDKATTEKEPINKVAVIILICFVFLLLVYVVIAYRNVKLKKRKEENEW